MIVVAVIVGLLLLNCAPMWLAYCVKTKLTPPDEVLTDLAFSYFLWWVVLPIVAVMRLNKAVEAQTIRWRAHKEGAA